MKKSQLHYLFSACLGVEDRNWILGSSRFNPPPLGVFDRRFSWDLELVYQPANKPGPFRVSKYDGCVHVQAYAYGWWPCLSYELGITSKLLEVRIYVHFYNYMNKYNGLCGYLINTCGPFDFLCSNCNCNLMFKGLSEKHLMCKSPHRSTTEPVKASQGVCAIFSSLKLPSPSPASHQPLSDKHTI